MASDTTTPRSDRMVRDSLQRRWAGALAPAQHIDWLLLAATVLLTLIGLVMIYSATQARLSVAGEDPRYYLNRQLLAVALGVVGAVGVTLFDYRSYRAWSPLAYGATLVTLVAVLLFGDVVNGAKAWLVLGPVQFQPAELAKVTLIVVLASHFHEYREEALGLQALLEALAFAALPMALIMLQPDFGTFVVFVAIVFGVLLMARVHVRYLAALVLLGVLAVVLALQLGLLEDYQIDRLTAFLDPEGADPAVVYNVNQAQIAIGSGQFLGQGLFQGTQTNASFVPENQTDFIFTVVGEQTGFLGSIVVLGLFGVVLWRGLRIAAMSRDTLGTLIAAGVIATFAFQLFINVGMTMGIMPVTGLPLPFISYGGTSLIASLIMVGLLQNVHMRRLSRT